MRTANGVSAVVIIFRNSYPNDIFIELKDDGHPDKLVRRQLCIFGGNWKGAEAKDDRSPWDTVVREVTEELSLDYPVTDGSVVTLVPKDKVFMRPPKRPASDFVPEADKKLLDGLRGQIAKMKPLEMRFNALSREALLSADPECRKNGVSGLSCYFEVGLEEYWWDVLIYLHDKYGNLSSEARTIVTSRDAIIEAGQKTAFAHDFGLRDWFAGGNRDSMRSFQLPMVEGGSSEIIGEVPESYDELQKEWNILTKPVVPVTS